MYLLLHRWCEITTLIWDGISAFYIIQQFPTFTKPEILLNGGSSLFDLVPQWEACSEHCPRTNWIPVSWTTVEELRLGLHVWWVAINPPDPTLWFHHKHVKLSHILENLTRKHWAKSRERRQSLHWESGRSVLMFSMKNFNHVVIQRRCVDRERKKLTVQHWILSVDVALSVSDVTKFNRFSLPTWQHNTLLNFLEMSILREFAEQRRCR